MSPGVVEETVVHVRNIAKTTTILQITDIHLCECDHRNPEMIEAMVERGVRVFPDGLAQFDDLIRWSNANADIDLVVLTGDAVDYPTEANLDCLADRLSRINKPWVMTFGNHEWPDDMPQNRDHWWRRFSRLLNRDFEINVLRMNKVRLIFIDNSDYQITQSQLDATRESLESKDDCLFFMHIPMAVESLRPDTIRVWNKAILMADRDIENVWETLAPTVQTLKFCELMRTHPRARAIFSGHLHFDHEDAFGYGRRQFVTKACFLGGSRLIRIVNDS